MHQVHTKPWCTSIELTFQVANLSDTDSKYDWLSIIFLSCLWSTADIYRTYRWSAGSKLLVIMEAKFCHVMHIMSVCCFLINLLQFIVLWRPWVTSLLWFEVKFIISCTCSILSQWLSPKCMFSGWYLHLCVSTFSGHLSFKLCYGFTVTGIGFIQLFVVTNFRNNAKLYDLDLCS